MRRSSARGFTLIEMIVVVTILGLAAAIVIPSLQATRRRSEVNDVVRGMEANLARARSLAARGQTNAAWAAGDRAVSAGVRIISTTQYAVFIDRDTRSDGDEVDVSIVDILRNQRSSVARITSPAVNTEIRFRANGSLTGTANVDIVVTGSSNMTKTVRVTPSGVSTIF